jgi:hypothetical protein
MFCPIPVYSLASLNPFFGSRKLLRLARADIRLNGKILYNFHLCHEDFGRCSAPENLATYVDELVYQYEQWYTAALSRRAGSQASESCPISQELASLFQPGSEAYGVLRFNCPSRVSRLAPLIYLHLLFHSLQCVSRPKALNLSKTYIRNLMDVNVTVSPTNETIVWGLMTNTYTRTLMDLPLLECTVRMLGTSGMLASANQERLGDTLCDFLSPSAENDIVQVDQWWSPTELRRLLITR